MPCHKSIELAVCFLVALSCAPVSAADGERWFVEVAEPAGVAHPHVNRSFNNPYAKIMEGYTALGASASVADFDGDGDEDVFFTTSDDGGKNRLYRNNGDFTFTDVAAAAGVAEGNDAANASADSLWLDMDGDADQDLLVVRFGQNLLYRNDGPGDGGQVRFTEVGKAAGLERYLNCIVAIAFDVDRDGDLDLVLGNYFAPVNLFDPQTPRFFPESFETANNGGGLTYLRNEGVGENGIVRFIDATAGAGLELSGWTLDLGHADADLDGDEDLYVAADFGTDRFFRNNGDGTFSDVTKTAIGIDTKKGMNADWGDFDNDGLFDVFVTNITDEYMKEGNFLWHNDGVGADGQLRFSDLARETGTHNTGWGWAGKFFDYDNDGWLDLYVVNGWVSGNEENYVVDIFNLIIQPNVDLADARNWPPMGEKTLSGYQKNSLFHNQGGTLFKDDAARHGVDSLLDGRGVAVADFDRDGRLDFFVANANANPLLFRNVEPSGNHWVELQLTGVKSNRDAVGTRVAVTVAGDQRLSFVNGGNGFASQSSRHVHFGLGAAKKLDKVEVTWPSGKIETFENVVADTRYALTEGAGTLRPMQETPAK
ncbi:MAG: CRTAC1 family protein [Thermoanaerobaculia bacterium]|nr:CRTAC1 family protein [Thermoanaerobaculia bacterium]